MRPRVYISGPLTNGMQSDDAAIFCNVDRAAKAFKQLHDLGFACHCPHTTIYLQWMHRTHLTHAEWIKHDLALICGFNALYRLPGESKGADMEVDFAVSIGIPVFTDMDELVDRFRERLP